MLFVVQFLWGEKRPLSLQWDENDQGAHPSPTKTDCIERLISHNSEERGSLGDKGDTAKTGMPWRKKSIHWRTHRKRVLLRLRQMSGFGLSHPCLLLALCLSVFLPGTGASDTHQVPLMGPHASPMVDGEPRWHNSANPSSPPNGPGTLGIRTLQGLPEEETTQSRAPTPGERVLSKLEDHLSAPWLLTIHTSVFTGFACFSEL